MFIFLSPFLSLAGLYIPLSTSLDSPSEIFLFLIFPLEAFIGLSFFISLVTRLLNEVILFSHAIEGLVFGTILTTLINALLSYTVIFPVPFVTITMGSVGVKLTYLYIYMRSIKPLPSSRPLFLSCIKATASFVLCVVLGLGWAVGFWYIEDKRLKSAFLLLYEPLRYASRYLILSPYLSSSPNFLPLTLSSDVFFAVFYCTVMKSEMEGWNTFLGVVAHIISFAARAWDMGDRFELFIDIVSSHRRRSGKRRPGRSVVPEGTGGRRESPVLSSILTKSMTFHKLKRDNDIRRVSERYSEKPQPSNEDVETGGRDGRSDDPPKPPPPQPLLHYHAIEFSDHKQRYYYLVLDLLLSESIDLWSRFAVEFMALWRFTGWNSGNYMSAGETSWIFPSRNAVIIPLNVMCVLFVLKTLPKTLKARRVWTYVVEEGWYLGLVMACVCMFCGGFGEVHHGFGYLS